MWLEIMLFVIGVYVLIQNIIMKTTGKVPKALISSKIKLERSKDVPGYISYMFPRGLVFSISLIIFSSILMVNRFVELPALLVLIVEILYLVEIIYFCTFSLKAQNKYLF